MAPSLRAALWRTWARWMGDTDLDEQIASGTDEEVRRGWLDGPYDEGSLMRLLGPSWICSRRFAVRQGEKIRLIDDFSISRINATAQSDEKIALQGVDAFVAACRHWHRVMPQADLWAKRWTYRMPTVSCRLPVSTASFRLWPSGEGRRSRWHIFCHESFALRVSSSIVGLAGHSLQVVCRAVDGVLR
eukprot:3436699-Amphidinium_carterae.1